MSGDGTRSRDADGREVLDTRDLMILEPALPGAGDRSGPPPPEDDGDATLLSENPWAAVSDGRPALESPHTLAAPLEAPGWDGPPTLIPRDSARPLEPPPRIATGTWEPPSIEPSALDTAPSMPAGLPPLPAPNAARGSPSPPHGMRAPILQNVPPPRTPLPARSPSFADGLDMPPPPAMQLAPARIEVRRSAHPPLDAEVRVGPPVTPGFTPPPYTPPPTYTPLPAANITPLPAISPDGIIGQTLGNLRIVDHIGEGGMGAVYRAEHGILGTPYAVKILRAETSQQPEMVERFRREAMTSSQLRHPHVVFTTDFGVHPAFGLYIVMEHLDGEPLKRVLERSGALPLWRAAAIAGQIADALDAAHAMGIVHRDLKPENVMLLARGSGDHVKVLDFGLARLVDNTGDEITRAGIVLGTPGYMAPEQAHAAPSIPVGPPTDVYALGVMLFRMITGHPLFVADSAVQMIVHHCMTPPPAASQYRSDLAGSALERLITAMLAKDPRQRPTAHDVREGLVEATAELRDNGVADALARPAMASSRGSVPAVPDDGEISIDLSVDDEYEPVPGLWFSELASRMGDLHSFPREHRFLAAWGVLSRDLLDVPLDTAAAAAAARYLAKLLDDFLGSALNAGPEAQETARRLVARSLGEVLAVAAEDRKRSILSALEPVAAHPLFPRDAFRKPAARPGEKAQDSLLSKLNREVSVKNIKSVLTHDIFGRPKK